MNLSISLVILAILLAVAWVILRIALAVTGAVLHLLWIGAVVLALFWVINLLVGKD